MVLWRSETLGVKCSKTSVEVRRQRKLGKGAVEVSAPRALVYDIRCLISEYTIHCIVKAKVEKVENTQHGIIK